MALARFDAAMKLQFASVGNVEVRARSGQMRIPFTLQRGIVGAQDSNVRVQEFAWNPQWLFVLHTDGLKTHWQWSDFPGLQHQGSQFIAQRLLRELAIGQDDATALVVKSRTP
jgi:hypothetical protein